MVLIALNGRIDHRTWKATKFTGLVDHRTILDFVELMKFSAGEEVGLLQRPDEATSIKAAQ